jgi:hypothetical protein
MFFSKNTTAAEFIPIRLMISVAVIAAISFLVFTGFQSIQSSSEIDSFENQLHMIQSEISLLYATGEARDLEDTFAPTGTTRVFSIHIPSLVTSISFGASDLSYKDIPNEDGSSGIFYKYAGGAQRAVWCDDQVVFLRGLVQESRWVTDGTSPFFSFSSSCEMNVTFELVSQDEHRFILIY